jgi:hypothetical protein
MRARASLVMAVWLAACSAFVPQPRPTCDPTQLGGAPTLTCEAAVSAAVASLPSHGPITALDFMYGSLCPPNARCMPPPGDAGTVIVTFGDGTRRSVYVWLEGGQLRTDPPTAYPPPWGEG